jgi:hypothetical protein
LSSSQAYCPAAHSPAPPRRSGCTEGELDIEPVPGEEVRKSFNGLFKLDTGLIDKLKDILYK